MKLLIAAALAVSATSVQASADLARSKNCMACHAVERKLVGPSFQDIAARYTAQNISQLAGSIQKGGAGRWGAIPMPANPSVTDDEAAALVRWILEQK